jgi:adenylate cyclase
MPPVSPVAEVDEDFYISGVLVRPSLNQITIGDTTRRIEPKAMDVLVRLAARPGQVVTKDELLSTVWAGNFVTEHVLVREVWQLRQALGDSGLIQNIPKRGYRLNAEVRTVPPEDTESGTTHPVSSAAPRRWPRHARRYVIIGALTMAAALAVTMLAVRQRAPGARISSLAVLPLANFSGDPSQDYLADAMTEELTTDLSKISALRVISRTSVMQYKGTKKAIPEIARDLNVDAVIEGSIQRAGTKVRVTVQLVQAATERHVWAQSYTRDATDVLSLRDELASAVADAVKIEVTTEDRARLKRGRTNVPEAQEAFLRGRHFALRGEWVKASEWYLHATQSDPNYARAWGNLAEAYDMRAFGGGSPEFRELRDTALVRAQELDPDLPEVRDLIGDLKFYRDHQWLAGEADYIRGVQLDPGSADAQFHYALSQWVLGRNEVALNEIRRTLSLDPLSPVVNSSLGALLFYLGRMPEASQQFRKVIELDPSFAPAHLNLARAYEQTGKDEMSVNEFLEAMRIGGISREEIDSLRETFRKSGIAAFRKQRFEKLLARVQQQARGVDQSPLQLAEIYAGLGKKDEAFKLLDQAYEKRIGRLAWIRTGPEWEPLRGDPRYEQFLRRMKYPN